MQCSSIYHSASGCWKRRKKEKPSLHIVKEKFTLIWEADKSIFIFHYLASMPMCDVLTESGNRGPSRPLKLGPARLEGPSLRTRLEGKSADAWLLLLLNDLMIVICIVATVCTLSLWQTWGKPGFNVFNVFKCFLNIKPQREVAEVKHFSPHTGQGVRACAHTQLPWLSQRALIWWCLSPLVLSLN